MYYFDSDHVHSILDVIIGYMWLYIIQYSVPPFTSWKYNNIWVTCDIQNSFFPKWELLE